MLDRLAIASALLALTSSIAHADWQYTRWGMTVEQVATASNGAMRPCTPNVCDGPSSAENKARLFGHYSSGQFEFTAFSLFDGNGRLARIYLRLEDPTKRWLLQDALSAKYGSHASKSIGFMTINYWQPADDRIEMRAIGDGEAALVNVQYFPRIDTSNKGL